MQYSQESTCFVVSLFNKFAGLKVCNVFKSRLKHRCFPVGIAKFYSCSYFWLSYHSTVKSPGVPVFWFRATTCFRFWSKLSWNVAQIILYYHVTRQFLPCLNWKITCFRFHNMFWKTIAFDFDEKLTQSVAHLLCNTHINRLSSPALCGWSGVFNFRVWFGKQHCGENPDFDFVPLLFALLT